MYFFYNRGGIKKRCPSDKASFLVSPYLSKLSITQPLYKIKGTIASPFFNFTSRNDLGQCC